MNPIWDFFLKVPAGGEAQCETCGVVLKTPTGTTRTLVTHLKRHPGKYKEYSELHQLYSFPKKKSEPKGLSSQLTVTSLFKPTLRPSSVKAQEMTKKIAAFIACGLQPYSVVEGPSFIEMMRCAIPEYVVPSRKTFSRTVVPDLYAAQKNEQKSRIGAVFDDGGEEAASFARSLLRSLATRFPGLKMANVPANAILVDPRNKDICYTEDSQKKWAKATLAAAANELMPAQNECSQAPVYPAMEKPPANTLWSVFSSLTSNVLQDNAHESVPSQVVEYLGAPVLPQSENPLEWWKTHGSRLYPALAKVAQKQLSIPATQSRSERLFSIARNVVSSRRELLLPDHVEQLVFLHENLRVQ
ncbi:hypothetical protein HPB51_020980 [Rhipicephalus microplus]|uniref:BED-type domain-containing protein n=1 Tax=Rhipicephalus microplus TaxID=6941 RepID=A0A9J6DXK4_RHIMP|nr:hypothetical protein HPB51_020980 [Rhipicephalus microplus]